MIHQHFMLIGQFTVLENIILGAEPSKGILLDRETARARVTALMQEYGIDVDPDRKTIMDKELIDAPPHQPGLLPGWLAERGAEVIIAGGMGVRAQQLFAQQNIRVVIGAPSQAPEDIAQAFLDEALQTGPNLCDH